MIISARHLSVKLGDKNIIEDISIDFAEHRRTAIIGANGAGKSTLLRALALINSDYDGEIMLDNEDIRRIGRKKLARNLAILPQGVAAPPDITVRSLVDYGRFPYRGMLSAGDTRKDREVVAWAMDTAKVASLADRRVATLSGGERQRAFIAMTIAQQPKILLLDEPTTYLDIAHQLEVMDIVRRVNAEYGVTIIMVLHDINHALKYADEIAVIKDRRLYRQGKPNDVLTVESLAEIFGVRAEIFVNSNGESIISPVALVQQKNRQE